MRIKRLHALCMFLVLLSPITSFSQRLPFSIKKLPKIITAPSGEELQVRSYLSVDSKGNLLGNAFSGNAESLFLFEKNGKVEILSPPADLQGQELNFFDAQLFNNEAVIARTWGSSIIFFDPSHHASVLQVPSGLTFFENPQNGSNVVVSGGTEGAPANHAVINSKGEIFALQVPEGAWYFASSTPAWAAFNEDPYGGAQTQRSLIFDLKKNSATELSSPGAIFSLLNGKSGWLYSGTRWGFFSVSGGGVKVKKFLKSRPNSTTPVSVMRDGRAGVFFQNGEMSGYLTPSKKLRYLSCMIRPKELSTMLDQVIAVRGGYALFQRNSDYELRRWTGDIEANYPDYCVDLVMDPDDSCRLQRPDWGGNFSSSALSNVSCTARVTLKADTRARGAVKSPSIKIAIHNDVGEISSRIYPVEWGKASEISIELNSGHFMRIEGPVEAARLYKAQFFIAPASP